MSGSVRSNPSAYDGCHRAPSSAKDPIVDTPSYQLSWIVEWPTPSINHHEPSGHPTLPGGQRARTQADPASAAGRGRLRPGRHPGAAGLGVGEVCAAAGLTKRYFYESFGSIDELSAAVVDHAIAVMVERTEPFRPGERRWIGAHAGIKAFVGCPARRPSPGPGPDHRDPGRRPQPVPGPDRGRRPSPRSFPSTGWPATESLDHRRFIAYAQIGALGEICLAWHQGTVAIGRDELVDRLVDLFARIAGSGPS